MSGCLYILTGASGCGKTTLLRSICAEPLASELKAVRAPKYSERAVRGEDDDVIHDPEVHVGKYDIAYCLNNVRYGIRTGEISSILDLGSNAFIILSDLRVVRRLKAALPGRAKAIYISSDVNAERLQSIQVQRYGLSNHAKDRLWHQLRRAAAAARLHQWVDVAERIVELGEEWGSLLPEAQSTRIRSQKTRDFYTRYIEYLALFDHVILNYTENRPEEMVEQARNLVTAQETLSPVPKAYPPVFVVAASSGAGKGTLMEMLGLIGSDRVAITSKMARRRPKPEDKRDGMRAIGVDGTFPAEFDLRWMFHKPQNASEGYQGTEYAVSTTEIRRNIEHGMPQIFIANMKQFDSLRMLFGDHAVFLYLHRMASAEDVGKFQYDNCDTKEEAETRIAEIAQVHRDYITSIASFDHVLLNTSFPEDLYDQMFQLLEYYRDTRLRHEFEEWRSRRTS